MKTSAYRYILSVLFLLIFCGGIASWIYPSSQYTYKPTEWQMPGTENESSQSETGTSEPKEIIADILCSGLSLLQESFHKPTRPHTGSVQLRTQYLSVPTPPPDRV